MLVFCELGNFRAVGQPNDGRLVIDAVDKPTMDNLQKAVEGLGPVEIRPGKNYPYRTTADRYKFALAFGKMAVRIDYNEFRADLNVGPNMAKYGLETLPNGL